MYPYISFDFIHSFCMQGWTTLQLTRDPSLTRGFMLARTVTGFLADVYATAADELGKIHIIADEEVCIHLTWYIGGDKMGESVGQCNESFKSK